MLTPARRRGVEILDQPGVDPALQVRSLADVALANRLFGGARAVLVELRGVVPVNGAPMTLLDVGSGIGDIARGAVRLAAARGTTLACTALDAAESLARASRVRGSTAACGDARALPFADASVDIVTCSQLLHHFADDEARVVLRELDRVARRRVIVADLRRSWVAFAGIWAASFPLGFHPVSRHDGMLSVLRGFTVRELAGHVEAATGGRADVRRRLGFRVTASWTPGGRPPAVRPADGAGPGTGAGAGAGAARHHRRYVRAEAR